MNGATNAPEAPSTWTGMSSPVSLLQVVERGADLGDRLVAAVERRAEDRDDADRVLVAVLHRLLGGQVEAVALHRHEPRLDVPVVGELLPADLDVDAHDEVRLVDRLAGGRARAAASAASAPGRRACRPRWTRSSSSRSRSSASGACHRSASMATQRRSSSAVCGYSSLSIMFLSKHSAISCVGLRLHPGGHERREVQPRVAVEHQLVVDDLVRDVGRHLAARELEAGDRAGVHRDERLDRQILGSRDRSR